MREDITLNKYEIESGKNNYYTVKVNGYYLHSRYNPTKEAEKFANQHFRENYLHILFGYGLGYIVNEFKRMLTDNEFLIVIEPNETLYNEAQKIVVTSDSGINSRCLILVGGLTEDVQHQINYYIESFYGRVSYFNSPNYENLYPHSENKIAEFVKEKMLFSIMNLNTIHRFSLLWQENFISNLYYAASGIPLSSLYNKFSFPVIIVSGGPSLTKQLSLLSGIGDKALVICAGSTINTLLKENIRPHIVVTIDGAIENYTAHFKGIDIDDIPLMISLGVHKDIPFHHKGKKIVFTDHENSANWVKTLVGQDIGFIQGGPSVANYTFEIALKLTSGPICFIGQDLAFTNNLTHAEGNKLGGKLTDNNVTDNIMVVKTEGYYGQDVLTSIPLLSMKREFEQAVAKLKVEEPNRVIVNATEGGASIEGTIVMSFSEYISQYCVGNFTNEIKQITKPELNEGSLQIDWGKFKGQINVLISDINEAVQQCQLALTLIKKWKNSQKSKLLIELDRIDEDIKRYLQNEFMFYVLQPVLIRVQHRYLPRTNENETQKYNRLLKKSEDLYSGIIDAASKTNIWLVDLIDRVSRTS